MFKLNINTEPYWMDLPHDVKIKVRPLTTSVFNAAQSWATKEINKVVVEKGELTALSKDSSHLPDLEDEDVRYDFLNTMIMKGCAIAGIIEWTGIEDPVNPGELAPTTPENIINLVEDLRMGNIFWKKVTTDFSKVLDEGNSSSLEQSGTSAEEVVTAHAAETMGNHAQEEKK